MLKILSDFYEEERYSRFDFFSYDFKDRNILVEYIQKYCKDLRYDYITGKEILLNTDTVKELLEECVKNIMMQLKSSLRRISWKDAIIVSSFRT